MAHVTGVGEVRAAGCVCVCAWDRESLVDSRAYNDECRHSCATGAIT